MWNSTFVFRRRVQPNQVAFASHRPSRLPRHRHPPATTSLTVTRRPPSGQTVPSSLPPLEVSYRRSAAARPRRLGGVRRCVQDMPFVFHLSSFALPYHAAQVAILAVIPRRRVALATRSSGCTSLNPRRVAAPFFLETLPLLRRTTEERTTGLTGLCQCATRCGLFLGGMRYRFPPRVFSE